LKLGQGKGCLQALKARPGNDQNNRKTKRETTLRGKSKATGEGSFDSSSSYSSLSRESENSAEHFGEDRGHESSQGATETKEGEDEAETPANQSYLVMVKLDVENQFTFLQAICYKRNPKTFPKAQKEYRKLEKIFKSR